MEDDKIIMLTADRFEEEVLNALEPIVVDFYAEWCGPCKMLDSVLEELAHELDDKVKVCKLNISSEMNLARNYKVMGVPTILFFKNGVLRDKVTGLSSKQDIIKIINKML